MNHFILRCSAYSIIVDDRYLCIGTLDCFARKMRKTSGFLYCFYIVEFVCYSCPLSSTELNPFKYDNHNSFP